MSPIPHIGDYREKKKESHIGLYILSVVLGISIFLFLLLTTKVIGFLFRLAMKHGFYFIVGFLVLLILIKKIKKSRRKKEFERRNEYRYR